MQKKLSDSQISSFYHDEFVEKQITDFYALLQGVLEYYDNIVDVGGGCGYFAEALQQQSNCKVKVLDTDQQSVSLCRDKGLRAFVCDAIHPFIEDQDSIICFNLILHHLVGKSEYETLKLQSTALSAWRDEAEFVFVNEYIYESFFFENISGWLIYLVTNNGFLSRIGGIIGRLIPSLNANTFGVGVRFRSQSEWLKIFRSIGYEVVNKLEGPSEYISLARRLLLIKSCRRDSFLLRNKKG